jgi:hypothetical protein
MSEGTTKALAILLLGPGLLLACGDDDSPGDSDAATTDAAVADAAVADAAPPDAATDAGPPAFAGGLWIQEFAQRSSADVDPTLLDNPYKGATITIDFTGGTPLDFSEPGCTVEVWSTVAPPPAPVDQGPVTLSGTVHGRDIVCSVDDGAGDYRCYLDPGVTSPTATGLVDATGDTVVFTVPGAVYNDYNPTGATLEVSGVTPAAANGLYSIRLRDPNDPTRVEVVNNPGLAADTAITATASARFAVRPATLHARLDIQAGVDIDFMQNSEMVEPGNLDITLAKPDGATVAAFDETFEPAGGDDIDIISGQNYYYPQNMPLTDPGAEVKVGCEKDPADPNLVGCHFLPATGSRGALLIGRTTDVAPAVPTDPDSVMTALDAATSWATFVCVVPDSDQLTELTATLTNAEWNQILSTNPAVIETRLLIASSRATAGGGVHLVAGHGRLGYTIAD